MGADLDTVNKLWNALYHDAGKIEDEEPRERLKKLLETKLTPMQEIGTSGASQDSKHGLCDALEKELLEIKQEIDKHPKSSLKDNKRVRSLT